MHTGSHEFSRVEFAGSLGDLGTLLPLSIALITVNGLGFTSVFLPVGFFYLFTGLYYRLPIPVQPLKVVSAIAIAFPETVSLSVMSATGLVFGAVLFILAFSGAIDRLSKLFTKPVVRGIQLGLGLVLMTKGVSFIQRPDLFLREAADAVCVAGIPINPVIGLTGGALALLLISSRRFPAALVVVGLGIMIGVPFASLHGAEWQLGPSRVELFIPGLDDYITALFLLVIPQIPLTIGNAIIGTTDTARSLFGTGEVTKKATNKNFSAGMGLANMVAGAVAGMPMCHGAGGLAAHYRFGARTGGANIMIGAVFILLAVVFGKAGIVLLSSIPNAVLGVLLLFAGLELALLVRDVKEKKHLFIAFLIAGIGLSTSNMSAAFAVGLAVSWLMEKGKIEV